MALMLFNLIGYRLFFNYLQVRQQDQLEENLYSATKPSDINLKSVKVPVTFPYYNNNKTFEPATGEINVNGTYYKIVKKRIYGDSLEIVYMVDVDKSTLQTAKTNFEKQANGFETSKKNSKSPQPVKPLIYEYTDGRALSFSPPVLFVKCQFFSLENTTILLRNSCLIDHPPENAFA
jgi:hypothetical protein